MEKRYSNLGSIHRIGVFPIQMQYILMHRHQCIKRLKRVVELRRESKRGLKQGEHVLIAV